MRHQISAGVFFLAVLMVSTAPASAALTGRVIFDGEPPPAAVTEVKSDTAVCGTHKESPKIILGKENGIANAVVTVLGAAGLPQTGDGQLDQVNCEFVPHVQVCAVGAKFTITSSDAVLHNAHGFFEDESTAFNIAVPIAGMELSQKLGRPGVIKLRCDAGHTWMNGYIFVTAEPFAVVTDADGNFSIEGVPPGRYELEVWHEWLGRRREPVEIGAAGADVTVKIAEKI